MEKMRNTQTALAIVVSLLLTGLLVTVCFLTSKNGLLAVLDEKNKQNQGEIIVEKTVEEQIAEKEETMRHYTTILSSPYMAVVDKNTSAAEVDESGLVEVEGVRLNAEAAAQLKLLLAAARKEGLTVTVCDGYRSAEEQTLLYNNAVDTLVSAGHTQQEAETLVSRTCAKGGHSEHQTALAVDLFETKEVSASEMKATKLYTFLSEHCAEYGFIISYSDVHTILTGYDEKPWHFRYVGGAEQAEVIMSENITLAEYVSFLVSNISALQMQIDDLQGK